MKLTTYVGLKIYNVEVETGGLQGDFEGVAEIITVNGKKNQVPDIDLKISFYENAKGEGLLRGYIDGSKSLLWPSDVPLLGFHSSLRASRANNFILSGSLVLPPGDQNGEPFDMFIENKNLENPNADVGDDVDWNMNGKIDAKNPFPFPIQRNVILNGVITNAYPVKRYVIQGNYQETIYGMMAEPIELVGTFKLTRKETRPFTWRKGGTDTGVEPVVEKTSSTVLEVSKDEQGLAGFDVKTEILEDEQGQSRIEVKTEMELQEVQVGLNFDRLNHSNIKIELKAPSPNGPLLVLFDGLAQIDFGDADILKSLTKNSFVELDVVKRILKSLAQVDLNDADFLSNLAEINSVEPDVVIRVLKGMAQINFEDAKTLKSVLQSLAQVDLNDADFLSNLAKISLVKPDVVERILEALVQIDFEDADILKNLAQNSSVEPDVAKRVLKGLGQVNFRDTDILKNLAQISSVELDVVKRVLKGLGQVNFSDIDVLKKLAQNSSVKTDEVRRVIRSLAQSSFVEPDVVKQVFAGLAQDSSLEPAIVEKIFESFAQFDFGNTDLMKKTLEDLVKINFADVNILNAIAQNCSVETDVVEKVLKNLAQFKFEDANWEKLDQSHSIEMNEVVFWEELAQSSSVEVDVVKNVVKSLTQFNSKDSDVMRQIEESLFQPNSSVKNEALKDLARTSSVEIDVVKKILMILKQDSSLNPNKLKNVVFPISRLTEGDMDAFVNLVGQTHTDGDNDRYWTLIITNGGEDSVKLSNWSLRLVGQPVVDVFGIVKDDNNKPIADTEVGLYTIGNFKKTSRTDVNGRFTIERVPLLPVNFDVPTGLSESFRKPYSKEEDVNIEEGVNIKPEEREQLRKLRKELRDRFIPLSGAMVGMDKIDGFNPGVDGFNDGTKDSPFELIVESKSDKGKSYKKDK